MQKVRRHLPSPILVAAAAWVLPGFGYLLIGEAKRGLAIGVSVLSLFVLGLLIGGVRVIDPPGYGENGYKVWNTVNNSSSKHDPSTPQEADAAEAYARAGAYEWTLIAHPVRELINKLPFVGQILNGPVCLVAAGVSVHVARPDSGAVPRSHARAWEIGMLYTAVAGMLNLMAMMDSAHRALRPQNPEEAAKA